MTPVTPTSIIENFAELKDPRVSTRTCHRFIVSMRSYFIGLKQLYSPPYHSKYDPIERCWGILEEHWNGEILDSIPKAIKWGRDDDMERH